MIEDQIAKIRRSYGQNLIITGEFDPLLSAKCRNGTFVGTKKGDICEFRGIPYAKPPVRELRWKAPEAVEDNDTVWQAVYNGKSPIQTEWRTELASYYMQGEDCLYLNVWKNLEDDTKNKPVMVFFHGGSYGWGGTADPMYDGTNFATKQTDVILVTVGYRVGLMGFVDLSYFEGGADYPDAPNLGILDQIEALRWIKNNIPAFGGDPGNVTVFGESAGGGSVSLLPIIPRAKGLFKRVIAESGSVALTFSKQECREFSKRLMRESKARSVKELTELSEYELKILNENLNEYNNFPQRDGRLIPLDPYLPYGKGMTSFVDMMIGTNSEEMNYWIGEIGGVVPFRFSIPVKFENDMKKLPSKDKKRVNHFINKMTGHSMWRMARFYDEMMFRLPAVEQATLHNKNGGKAYMYYWTVPSKLPLRKACHAVELAYVFGNINETIYIGEVADEALSDTVTAMWTNFARTGDPSTDDLVWEEYTEQSRATMVFSEQPHIKYDVLSGRRKLLSPLLRHMINPSYATLDYNVPFVRKAIIRTSVLVAGIAGIALLAVNKHNKKSKKK